MKIADARAKAADRELKALQTESDLKNIPLKDTQFGEPQHGEWILL